MYYLNAKHALQMSLEDITEQDLDVGEGLLALVHRVHVVIHVVMGSQAAYVLLERGLPLGQGLVVRAQAEPILSLIKDVIVHACRVLHLHVLLASTE